MNKMRLAISLRNIRFDIFVDKCVFFAFKTRFVTRKLTLYTINGIWWVWTNKQKKLKFKLFKIIANGHFFFEVFAMLKSKSQCWWTNKSFSFSSNRLLLLLRQWGKRVQKEERMFLTSFAQKRGNKIDGADGNNFFPWCDTKWFYKSLLWLFVSWPKKVFVFKGSIQLSEN